MTILRNAQEHIRDDERTAARNAVRRERRAREAGILLLQLDAQRAADRKAKEPGAAVKIQRWAKRILHQANWKKVLESNEVYPVVHPHVDKATVNYIRNVIHG